MDYSPDFGKYWLSKAGLDSNLHAKRFIILDCCGQEVFHKNLPKTLLHTGIVKFGIRLSIQFNPFSSVEQATVPCYLTCLWTSRHTLACILMTTRNWREKGQLKFISVTLKLQLTTCVCQNPFNCFPSVFLTSVPAFSFKPLPYPIRIIQLTADLLTLALAYSYWLSKAGLNSNLLAERFSMHHWRDQEVILKNLPKHFSVQVL